MQSGIIELFAAILIAASLVKLVIVLINRHAWLALMKRVYAKPQIVSIASCILAGIVLYFLLDSGLTMVQILAVSLFIVLLVTAGLAPYANEVLSWAEGKDLKSMFKDEWLYALFWIVLLLWGTKEIVFG